MGLATSTAFRLTCDGQYCRRETPIARTRAAAIVVAIESAWRIEEHGTTWLRALCPVCRGSRAFGLHRITRGAKAVATT